MNRTICDTERELRRQQRCRREEAPPIKRLEPPARDHKADAQIEALAAQAMEEYRAEIAAMKAATEAEAAQPANEPQSQNPAPATAQAAPRPVAEPVDPAPAPRPVPRKPAPGVAFNACADLKAQVSAAHAALHRSLYPGQGKPGTNPANNASPPERLRRTA